jgi:predicted cobalt transporter CbtA
MTVSALLLRGLLAGLIAGLLAFACAKTVGEPQIDRAIGVEEQSAAAGHPASGHAHEHEAPLVSRETQSTVGLLTALLVYAMAMGGLFALVFAFLHGRVGAGDPRALALILAVAAFVVLALVPALKYPPNPPAVGAADTIAFRTKIYFATIGLSVLSGALAAWAGSRLAARHGAWNAAIAAGLLFIALVAAAQFLLPDLNEVPSDFPATLLWKFRIAALGMQAVLWVTLGLVFGRLVDDRSAERVLVAAPGIRR